MALSDHTHPACAVDLAVLTIEDGALSVLLTRRPDAEAVGGEWAMPGAFVHEDVGLEDTVRRALADKANLAGAYVEQLATFGDLGRDPRGRVISITYLALIPARRLREAVEPRDDLAIAQLRVPWEGEAGGPVEALCVDEAPGVDEALSGGGAPLALAFDHAAILGQTVRRLRGKIDYAPIAFELLPARFTLRALQAVHEAVLGRELLKPPFRRRMLDRGLIEPTGEREEGGAHRPAELYRRAGAAVGHDPSRRGAGVGEREASEGRRGATGPPSG